MAEQQRKAPDRPAAERYFVEYLSPSSVNDAGSPEVVLREVINEKAKVGWKLISMTKDPTSMGVILVWDTVGIFSG
jgi:hypothetical protein